MLGANRLPLGAHIGFDGWRPSIGLAGAVVLGAAKADVFRLVLGQGALLIAIGLAVGLLGALAAGRSLATLLYGVGTIDFPALATAIFSLSIVAMLACFFPARRATRVDPMVALREE